MLEGCLSHWLISALMAEEERQTVIFQARFDAERY